MRRFSIPVLVLVLLVLVLGGLYGGRLYRGYLFGRAHGDLLAAARAGDLAAVESGIIPGQRRLARDRVLSRVPADYPDRIQRLKTSHWKWLDDDSIVATVTCRYEEGGYEGIYQGRLVWRYQQGGWYWDFSGSSVSRFELTGDRTWVKLAGMLENAEQLY